MKVMMRKASVQWEGGARRGDRTVTTESGALKGVPYSRGIRARERAGTNPAELIAAAEAACFFLSLSDELKLSNCASGTVVSGVTVILEHLEAGWTIVNVHLNVTAWLPKLTHGEFIDAAVRAKTMCPISRLLNTNISMTAKLEN